MTTRQAGVLETTDRAPRLANTNVAWTTELPSHWRIRKLKHFSRVKFSNVDKHTNEDETIVSLCNYVNVYHNERISNDLELMQATATAEEIARFSLRSGDVIVTKDSESWDDIAVPAFVPSELDNVLCGYHLALIRPYRETMLGEFLFRAFQAPEVNDQFKVAATGITRYGLGKQWLENGIFPVPPIEEQRAIAAFLEHKTTHIDALIAEKRRLIQLLQEKRNALISHAVTKGLDPQAPMKDCGVEWIGKVPEHWEAIKTKYLFHLTTEQAPADHDYQLLSLYTDIGVRPRSELEPKGNKASSTDGYWIVRKGDIVVNKLLAWMGAIGISDYDGVTSPAYDILRKTTELESKYYDYLFRCGLYLPEFRRRSRGIMDMRLRLYFDELGQIPVLLPPLKEQREIVAFLNRKTTKITQLINEVTTAIERLQEYRTTLISAAVTGKIEIQA